MALEFQQKFLAEIIYSVDDFRVQLCCSPESKAIAYVLRYKAYLQANLIKEQPQESYHDKYDLEHILFGIKTGLSLLSEVPFGLQNTIGN